MRSYQRKGENRGKNIFLSKRKYYIPFCNENFVTRFLLLVKNKNFNKHPETMYIFVR